MRTKTNLLTLACFLYFAAAQAEHSESIMVVAPKDLAGYWSATHQVDPHYPRIAFNNGKQGCSVIGFVIDSDGTTSNHIVLFAYPDAAFNRAAINAYKEWTFEPAALNEKKEAVFTSMTAAFTWIDKEEDRPEMREQLAELCDQEGNKAMQKMVLNAPE